MNNARPSIPSSVTDKIKFVKVKDGKDLTQKLQNGDQVDSKNFNKISYIYWHCSGQASFPIEICVKKIRIF